MEPTAHSIICPPGTLQRCMIRRLNTSFRRYMLEQNRDLQPVPDLPARFADPDPSPATTPIIRSASSSSSSLQYYYFASPDEQPIYAVPTSSTDPPPLPPRRRYSEHVYEDPMDEMEYANIGCSSDDVQFDPTDDDIANGMAITLAVHRDQNSLGVFKAVRDAVGEEIFSRMNDPDSCPNDGSALCRLRQHLTGDKTVAMPEIDEIAHAHDLVLFSIDIHLEMCRRFLPVGCTSRVLDRIIANRNLMSWILTQYPELHRNLRIFRSPRAIEFSLC